MTTHMACSWPTSVMDSDGPNPAMVQIRADLSQLPLTSEFGSKPAVIVLTVLVCPFNTVIGTMLPGVYTQIVASLLPVQISSPPPKTQTDAMKFEWSRNVTPSTYVDLKQPSLTPSLTLLKKSLVTLRHSKFSLFCLWMPILCSYGILQRNEHLTNDRIVHSSIYIR